jgi:5-methylcytosine-specific restriction endonuclease McrA
MYDKTKLLSKFEVRIETNTLQLLDGYATMHKISRSEAIRELIKNGMQTKANIQLAEKFIGTLNTKWLNIQPKITDIINEGSSLIFVRDNFICQKCHNNKELDVYNIDRDPLNTRQENLITLCKNCSKKAEKYTPKRRVIEDFVEWFYLL